ncbi:MAG: hypothetical protein M1833_001599 [Piccolia ochrophora]|nr:MAG: hypothetical protein M1833_001599 [Piccolia ochrophora]
MSFPYQRVLVLGATSGIGEALATRLVQEGSFVIVAGRRKEKLDSFVSQHGKGKAAAMQLDVTRLGDIPSFTSSVIEAHPDLDCIILNSGIQRGFDFSKPASIDLSVIEEEFNTNYISYIHLLTAFLPFFQEKKSQSAMVFTSSGLGLVPMVRCPNYCATKAALHQFVLTLREQLKEYPIKIMEIMPPSVRTELHDEKHQPDIKKGREIGMPLDEFIEGAYQGLVAGQNDIPVGLAQDWYQAFEPQRQQKFREATETMSKMMSQHT